MIGRFHGFDTRGMYLRRMLRHDRYKYVFNPADVDELYDLTDDPHEMTNRIDDPVLAGVREALRRCLVEEMTRGQDPRALSAADLLEP